MRRLGRRLVDLLPFFLAQRTITGDRSKQDQIWSVKIGKYIGFRVYRGSYLLWPPVMRPEQLGESRILNPENGYY